MKQLRRSILSTLALAHAEGQTSLSLQEIAERLHKNPGEKRRAPTLLEITRELSLLVHSGHIIKRDGCFSLAEKKETGAGKDFSEEKMCRARTTLSLLSAVPFVRSLAVTGSVSFGNAGEESDLDILLLAKKGRVWTARLFSLAVLELARRRRDAQGKARKICLNYLLAEDAEPGVRNIASANMFKHGIVVFGTPVFLDFIRRNGWTGEFLHHPEPHAARHEEKRGRSFFLSFTQFCAELVLAGIIGSLMEKWARAWQEKRLYKKKGGPENSPHFFFSDSIIALHHPDPKNARVMARYGHILTNIAFSGPERYNTEKKHEKNR